MFPPAARRSGRLLPTPVLFHHFHGSGHAPSQGSWSAEELERFLDRLGDRLWGAPAWLDALENDELPADAVCLTFDDGLRSQLDVALPVLRRRNVTALWFVPTAALEPQGLALEAFRWFRHRAFPNIDDFYAAFEQRVLESPHGARARRRLASFDPAAYLPHATYYSDGDRRFRFLRDRVLGPQDYFRTMEAMMEEHGTSRAAVAPKLGLTTAALRDLVGLGHELGLHSHTHPTRIEELDETAQRTEYAENAQRLEAVTGLRPTVAAHPANSYGPETLRVLSSLGVRHAFRADAGPASRYPFELPRVDSTLAREWP